MGDRKIEARPNVKFTIRRSETFIYRVSWVEFRRCVSTHASFESLDIFFRQRFETAKRWREGWGREARQEQVLHLWALRAGAVRYVQFLTRSDESAARYKACRIEDGVVLNFTRISIDIAFWRVFEFVKFSEFIVLVRRTVGAKRRGRRVEEDPFI